MNNISSVAVTNVYSKTVVVNNTSRTSFNGGAGGTKARPTPQQLAFAKERHVPPTQEQTRHVQTAAKDPSLSLTKNQGHPAVAATAHPAQLTGPGVSREARQTGRAHAAGNPCQRRRELLEGFLEPLPTPERPPSWGRLRMRCLVSHTPGGKPGPAGAATTRPGATGPGAAGPARQGPAPPELGTAGDKKKKGPASLNHNSWNHNSWNHNVDPGTQSLSFRRHRIPPRQPRFTAATTRRSPPNPPPPAGAGACGETRDADAACRAAAASAAAGPRRPSRNARRASRANEGAQRRLFRRFVRVHRGLTGCRRESPSIIAPAARGGELRDQFLRRFWRRNGSAESATKVTRAAAELACELTEARSLRPAHPAGSGAFWPMPSLGHAKSPGELAMAETTNALAALSDSAAQLVERTARSVVAVHSGGRWPRAESTGVPASSLPRKKFWNETKTSTYAPRWPPRRGVPRRARSDHRCRRPALSARRPTGGGDDKRAPRAGDMVLAVGNHEGSPLAALGIVALAGGPWHSARGGTIDNFIRLDLALSPVGEGGALVGAHGQVMAMTVLGPRHRAIAIPASTIERSVDQLLARGQVFRGYLGAGLRPIGRGRASGGAAGSDEGRGVLVVSIDPEGPSRRAGLLLGDIVTAWNGKPIARVREVMQLLGPESVGTTVDLGLTRGGAPAAPKVVIGERPVK